MLEVDAEPREQGERLPGFVDPLLETWPRPAVVAERVEGRGRHRVDRVPADQGFDVVDVREGGVLGARARPEQPLGVSTTVGEAFPARAGEELLVELVG